MRDRQAGVKRGGGGARTLAIVYDPSLTLRLPPGESAGSSMNALAHCAEALSVRGRAAFSGVATGAIAARSDSAFVAAPTIGDGTLVSLTLTGDPGNATPWVEVQPGKGFIVHLTAKAKGPLSFTYLLIEHEG